MEGKNKILEFSELKAIQKNIGDEIKDTQNLITPKICN